MSLTRVDKVDIAVESFALSNSPSINIRQESFQVRTRAKESRPSPDETIGKSRDVLMTTP
jgi:hypothetical protein